MYTISVWVLLTFIPKDQTQPRNEQFPGWPWIFVPMESKGVVHLCGQVSSAGWGMEDFQIDLTPLR